MSSADLAVAAQERYRVLEAEFAAIQAEESKKQRELARAKVVESFDGSWARSGGRFLPVARTAAVAEDPGRRLKLAGERVGQLAASSAQCTAGINGNERKLKFPVGTLAAAAAVPRYKAWSYLVQNEQATSVGLQMFITDATGETVPVDTDEEDDEPKIMLETEVVSDSSEGGWQPSSQQQAASHGGGVRQAAPRLSQEEEQEMLTEGVQRERLLFLVQRVCAELGSSAPVVQMLAAELGISPGAVEGLRRDANAAGGPAPQAQPPTLAQATANLSRHFCRRCCVYDCLAHRAEHVRPLTQPAPLARPRAPKPCGEACYLLAPQEAAEEPVHAAKRHKDDASASAVIAEVADNFMDFEQAATQQSTTAQGASGQGDWTADEQGSLQRGQLLFGRNPCSLARLLGSRSCAEVAQRLGGAVRLQVVQRRAKRTQALFAAYEPCSCPGGCGTDCPCLARAHFCSKFCACGPGCEHYVRGCSCTSDCRLRTCPCYAADYECDPDVCKGCACAVLGGSLAEGKEPCRNMSLRLRQHKRVAIGLSKVAGWGVFLMEPARKHDLIGEYTGELIDQREADRRGKVYDKEDNSYLFDLNETWVIDARSKGNKLRFANHSPDPNCVAKILQVDGDHRISFSALKDLSAGSELTIDYKYTLQAAPTWWNPAPA